MWEVRDMWERLYLHVPENHRVVLWDEELPSGRSKRPQKRWVGFLQSILRKFPPPTDWNDVVRKQLQKHFQATNLEFTHNGDHFLLQGFISNFSPSEIYLVSNQDYGHLNENKFRTCVQSPAQRKEIHHARHTLTPRERKCGSQYMRRRSKEAGSSMAYTTHITCAFLISASKWARWEGPATHRYSRYNAEYKIVRWDTVTYLKYQLCMW